MDHPAQIPNEIFLKILQNLGFKSLLIGTLVCKKWKDTIRNDRKTGGYVTLRYQNSVGKKLTSKEVMEMLKVWPKLQELTIVFTGAAFFDTDLENWQSLKFDRCPNVKTIKLWEAYFDERLLHREVPQGMTISRLEVNPRFFENYETTEITGMSLEVYDLFVFEDIVAFFEQFHVFHPQLERLDLTLMFHCPMESQFLDLALIQRFLDRLFDSKCIKENINRKISTMYMIFSLENMSIEDLIKMKNFSKFLVRQGAGLNINFEFNASGLLFDITSEALKIFMLKDSLSKYDTFYMLHLFESISILTEGFGPKDVYLKEINFNLMDLGIFFWLKVTNINALFFYDCHNVDENNYFKIWKLLKCPRSLYIKSTSTYANFLELLYLLEDYAGDPLENLMVFSTSRKHFEKEAFMDFMKSKFSKCKSVAIGRSLNGTILAYKNKIWWHDHFLKELTNPTSRNTYMLSIPSDYMNILEMP